MDCKISSFYFEQIQSLLDIFKLHCSVEAKYELLLQTCILSINHSAPFDIIGFSKIPVVLFGYRLLKLLTRMV